MDESGGVGVAAGVCAPFGFLLVREFPLTGFVPEAGIARRTYGGRFFAGSPFVAATQAAAFLLDDIEIRLFVAVPFVGVATWTHDWARRPCRPFVPAEFAFGFHNGASIRGRLRGVKNFLLTK